MIYEIGNKESVNNRKELARWKKIVWEVSLAQEEDKEFGAYGLLVTAHNTAANNCECAFQIGLVRIMYIDW